jgi:hypothetical protein
MHFPVSSTSQVSCLCCVCFGCFAPMKVDLTRKRLERAGKLTSGLADEGIRWQATADQLQTQTELLVGDVFLSAACIAYYGAFTGSYRCVALATLLNNWLLVGLQPGGGESRTSWHHPGLALDASHNDHMHAAGGGGSSAGQGCAPHSCSNAMPGQLF